MKFLRCFGHLIITLSYFANDRTEQRNAEIHRYINEYCADSLVKIHFKYSVIKFTIEKPFLKVETVIFSQCHLDSNIADFNRWFPRMQRLEVCSQCSATGGTFIEKHFPNLDNLSISKNDRTVNALFRQSNVAEVLRLNPQLRRLQLGGVFTDENYLRSVSHHLQNIVDLELVEWYPVKLKLEKGVINFKNVERFKIGRSKLLQTPEIPFSFDRLEEFELFMNISIPHLDAIIRFIGEHPKLIKVTIGHMNYKFIEATNALKLAKVLSKMKIIDFGSSKLSVNDAIIFVQGIQLLQKFRFKLDDFSKFDDLQKYLGEEWLRSIDNNRFVELKRETFQLYTSSLSRN